ncbi:Hexokinase [Zancudomyces culisetae]|uniref:Phosphotransferase n=1 Tax=Zancudomyces culisetae TaxID=1213189 RepID=A0A1R1PXN3_ZANCU|nr:Hexokinase [Zancudomyces culisetae]|eukprot:OMH85724.1 Hexokinase [Zancudomyces culisetae]
MKTHTSSDSKSTNTGERQYKNMVDSTSKNDDIEERSTNASWDKKKGVKATQKGEADIKGKPSAINQKETHGEKNKSKSSLSIGLSKFLNKDPVFTIPSAPKETNAKLNLLARDFLLSDDVIEKIIAKVHDNIHLGLNVNFDKFLDDSPFLDENATMPITLSFVEKNLDMNMLSGLSCLSLFLDQNVLRIGFTAFLSEKTPINSTQFEISAGQKGADPDQGKYSTIERGYRLTNEAKSEHLFGWIANCVYLFTDGFGIKPQSRFGYIPCGFVFSLPRNEGDDSKDTTPNYLAENLIPGVVDGSFIENIQNALDALELNVKIISSNSDAVGQLVSSNIQDSDSFASVVIGAAINSCFWEKVYNIPKLDSNSNEDVIVNVEWNSFDNRLDTLVNTFYDNRALRLYSGYTSGPLEVMLSESYLGEIIRNILLDFIDRQYIFRGRSSAILNSRFSFDPAYMALILSDDSPYLTDTFAVVTEILQIPDVTTLDILIVRNICLIVIHRTAKLYAIIISTTLLFKKDALDSHECYTVSINEPIHEYLPGFDNLVLENLHSVLGKPLADKLKLNFHKDGPIFGCAVAALMAVLFK